MFSTTLTMPKYIPLADYRINNVVFVIMTTAYNCSWRYKIINLDFIFICSIKQIS